MNGRYLGAQAGMAKDETSRLNGWSPSMPMRRPRLREGLHETFTVNALGLPPSLTRCLCTTNFIENPNGIVRRTAARQRLPRRGHGRSLDGRGFIEHRSRSAKSRASRTVDTESCIGSTESQAHVDEANWPRNVSDRPAFEEACCEIRPVCLTALVVRFILLQPPQGPPEAPGGSTHGSPSCSAADWQAGCG